MPVARDTMSYPHDLCRSVATYRYRVSAYPDVIHPPCYDANRHSSPTLIISRRSCRVFRAATSRSTSSSVLPCSDPSSCVIVIAFATAYSAQPLHASRVRASWSASSNARLVHARPSVFLPSAQTTSPRYAMIEASLHTSRLVGGRACNIRSRLRKTASDSCGLFSRARCTPAP
ncbi:hypothetical protein ABW21_db0200134 [Orbilia brochopaga]|nr:hypothetical protein ABW21_db0200134 [Drechslerella brochopaga]